MARYSYHVYIEGKYVAQFSSINKALNNMHLPIEKKLEIGRFYRQAPFEKHHMNTYEDKDLGLKIEVKPLF